MSAIGNQQRFTVAYSASQECHHIEAEADTPRASKHPQNDYVMMGTFSSYEAARNFVRCRKAATEALETHWDDESEREREED